MSREGPQDCKVYVGDLPRGVTERDLEDEFGHYGRLVKVWVARNPPGFAFVEYEDPRDAEDAVSGLDGTNMCGSKIRVEHCSGKSRPKQWDRRPPSRGPPRGRGFNPDDRCYACDERGHYAYDCPKGENRRVGGGRRRSGSNERSSRKRRSYSRSRSRSRGRYRRSKSRSRSFSRSPRRTSRNGFKNTSRPSRSVSPRRNRSRSNSQQRSIRNDDY